MGSLWACVAMVQENMKEATGSRVHGETQQKMQGLCHTLKLSAFFILSSLVTPSQPAVLCKEREVSSWWHVKQNCLLTEACNSQRAKQWPGSYGQAISFSTVNTALQAVKCDGSVSYKISLL